MFHWSILILENTTQPPRRTIDVVRKKEWHDFKSRLLLDFNEDIKRHSNFGEFEVQLQIGWKNPEYRIRRHSESVLPIKKRLGNKSNSVHMIDITTAEYRRDTLILKIATEQFWTLYFTKIKHSCWWCDDSNGTQKIALVQQLQTVNRQI